VGRVLTCEARDCDVIVTGYSDARIPWPKGRQRGSPSSGLVLYGALAEAVRREANQAVAYWFGVSDQTVSKWRKALGVDTTNVGTHRLRVGYGAEEWFAEVGAKGRATPWTDERRRKMSEQFKGKPVAPHVAAAIRKAQRKRLGSKHTPETRAKMRAAATARLARGLVPNGRAWTEAEDELVLTLPTDEAARRAGRSVTAVYKRRRKLRPRRKTLAGSGPA
jgi:hypothetical protein